MTTKLEVPQAPPEDSGLPRRRNFMLDALLLGASAVLACLLGQMLFVRFPGGLPRSTDVVGYPIFANFNVTKYFRLYYVVILVVPGATLAVNASLRILARRLGWPISSLRQGFSETARPHQSPKIDASDSVSVRMGDGARTLFIGAVLGLEAAVVAGRSGPRVLALVALTATLYALAVICSVRLARPWLVRWTGGQIAAVNAAFASLTVLGLSAVSAVTKVMLPGLGSHQYPFFPWWLGLTVTVALGAVLLTAVHHAADGEAVRRIEHRGLLFVVAPVCLFVLLAVLPGALAGVDLFHEGEGLAAARLVRSGLFPWRDFAFIHGPFQDIIRPLFGFVIFDDSRWGALAGESLLLVPLYWLAHYYLLAVTFRRVSLALLASLVMALAGPSNLRLLLWPLILLVLGAALRDRRPRWSALLVLLLGAQFVLSPEAAFALPACGLSLLGYELVGRRAGCSLRENFPRSLTCLAAGSAFGAAWMGYLAAHGAAGAFVQQVLMFGRDHRLTGGISIYEQGFQFKLAVYVPVAAVLTTIAYVATRVGSRRELAVDDWVLIAAGIMTALYYTKFLSRADLGHAFQPFAISLVLVALLGGRLVHAAGRWTSRLAFPPSAWSKEPVAAAMVVLLCVAAVREPIALARKVAYLPLQFAPQAPGRPPLARLGYESGDAATLDLIKDIDLVLRTYLHPGDRLFDFTNQPALFHYLLERLPSTRYYHVSMAIRRESQQELIAELRRARPPLVIFDHDSLGLPAWDGIPNAVRHYEVSQYLLDTYRPLVALDGYLILVAKELPPSSVPPLPSPLARKATVTDLLFRNHPCTWGFAPNFLESGQADEKPAIALPFQVVSPTLVRIQLPRSTHLSDYRWFEVETAGGLRRDDFGLVGSDQPGHEDRVITFHSLNRGSSHLRVRVGSCPQWHAYSGAMLDLRHVTTQQIRAVRLSP